MALTSTNTRLTKAENRRKYHWKQINDATDIRSRIWRAAGWLVTEIRRRPLHEQDEAMDQLVELASQANERNGGDDYT